MRILIACERSGRVRDAFSARGHFAMSCDLHPSDTPGPHYQGDVRDLLHLPWDMIIAFPDCTYLCGSGWHWVTRGRIEDDGRPRIEHVHEAVAFAAMFIDGPETSHIPRRVVENPIGRLPSLLCKWSQIIQPHQFGDDASKATCLWLRGVPLLVATEQFPPRIVNGRPRWGNQTDSGQNKLGPSDDRAKLRADTYPGIALAMATQWG